ncbi:alanine--tRNA ligase [Candidatus Dependentiae bacterium]|nr:MAG: alanine--tRNA ligase [Candidatus Dependentiae bacterium]
MQSLDIRAKFFAFFGSKKHTLVESSSLIPAQDPTILFTNAGMNQFKDMFLGLETRSYNRAVTIQKCVRAGGKHNDLDNVGFTKRHLTFFEMMGNFSFGDYFKQEAIVYAWEFLTEHIGLPKEQLYVTVFETDDQAYDIWHTVVGIPKEKIYRLGAESNFWQMGDVGPCGPCTEIFVDRGSKYGDDKESPATGGERFLEIWNLVFMQYDRQLDGTLVPLKKTGVDTGMGLERLASVVQQKNSVYHTDLFYPIIEATEKLVGQSYNSQTDELKAAFHVLADHIRSTTFLIAAGCVPSNEGRGYVLRKIIRRAALFTQKLTQQNIFPELSKTVIAQYGLLYPELQQNSQLIWNTLHDEIEKFTSNLVRGMQLLDELFAKNRETKSIGGIDAFKLYDTYGFPFEITCAAAWQKGFTVDQKGFEQAMEEQKNKSGNKTVDVLAHLALPDSMKTIFTGYEELVTQSTIIGLIMDNQLIDKVPAGATCFVITHKSPFFIVGGGQVPDNGWLDIEHMHTAPLLQVRYIQQAIAASIVAPVDLTIGMSVTCRVNKELRTNAMKNHTATHLLQAALMQRFGNQIKQAGSLVHPDYLRFDFSCNSQITQQDIEAVEQIVNNKIMENIPLSISYMSLKEATNKGALAFFGDKYTPEKVRVIDVPNFSVELCGGTHVRATGDIGVFKITELLSLAAGQKRIIALTGPEALKLFQHTYSSIKRISVDAKIKINEVDATIEKQKTEKKALETELKKTKLDLVHALVPTWLQHSTVIKSVPVYIVENINIDGVLLQDIATAILQKAKGVVFLMRKNNKQEVSLLLTASPEYIATINFNGLADQLKNEYGLKCGAQKTSLQGGGHLIKKVDIGSIIDHHLG